MSMRMGAPVICASGGQETPEMGAGCRATGIWWITAGASVGGMRMSSQGWGEQLKLEGFEQALSAPSKQSWINDARIVIRNLALESLHTGHPFTSEHVIAQIGLPAGEIGQHRNNQVGA